MSKFTDKRLDDLLKIFVDSGIPGCALAVNYRGQRVYEGYCGMARLEDRTKIAKDTIYRIYSNTKNITATAVMQLFERGLLLLNDPVEMYLPCFENMLYQRYDGSGEVTLQPTTRSITIKDLLTMTSGIPYYGIGSVTTTKYLEAFGDGTTLNNMELAKEISAIPLAFDPSSHWQYGLGYDVLGAVIETISGKTLGEYFHDEIFMPLGMKETSFYCTDAQMARLANVYDWTDGIYKTANCDMFITQENGHRLESGGGGLVSVLEDLLCFANMWALGGTVNGIHILGRNTISLMQKNHLRGQALLDFQSMSKYSYPWYQGYGWGLAGRTLVDASEAGSNSSFGEFGWCGMGGTYILADPSRQLAIAYAQQTLPVIGGKQDYSHPRIRNAVYSLLDAWES